MADYQSCKPGNEIVCEAGMIPDVCHGDKSLYSCVPCPDDTFSSKETYLGDLCEMRQECTEKMIELPESVKSKTMDAKCVCKDPDNFEMHETLFYCYPKGHQASTQGLPPTQSASSWNTGHILLPVLLSLGFIVIIVLLVVYYKKKVKKLEEGYEAVVQFDNGSDGTDHSMVLSQADDNRDYNDKALGISKIFLSKQLKRGKLPEFTRILLPDGNALDNIKERVGDDLREQIIQVICEWIDTKGDRAKIRDLYNALGEIGDKLIAQNLCAKIHKEIQGQGQISNGASPQGPPDASQSNGHLETQRNGGSQANGSGSPNGASPLRN